MILTRFNRVSCLHYTKAHLLYRWKFLKKDYAAYLYLRNKSGWAGMASTTDRLLRQTPLGLSLQINIANIATSRSFTLATFRCFSVKTVPQVCMPSPLAHPWKTKELERLCHFHLQARES